MTRREKNEQRQIERDAIFHWLRHNMKDSAEKDYVLVHIKRAAHRTIGDCEDD